MKEYEVMNTQQDGKFLKATTTTTTTTTRPSPWQQIEELVLIQRELTAELLATQNKNKALVEENTALRGRLSSSIGESLSTLFIAFIPFTIAYFSILTHSPIEDQRRDPPSTRQQQLESENQRLTTELARYIKGSYSRAANAVDAMLKEVSNSEENEWENK